MVAFQSLAINVGDRDGAADDLRDTAPHLTAAYARLIQLVEIAENEALRTARVAA